MYKELAKALNYKQKSGLVIGDLREQLARDTLLNLEKVINTNKRREKYYLLVHAGNFGKNIKTTIMISDKEPPKLLGTICLKVDNVKGRIDRLWVLPYDIPKDDGDLSDVGIEEVFKSVQGIPLKH